MIQKIKVRRGLKKDLPVLDANELGFCTDTTELYIGTTSGNALLGGSSTDKTTVTKGSNGTINVDGIEIKVFDDEQIKNLIDSKVDVAALNYKADVTDLDKAISAVNSNLFGKVNKTEVESLLANKVEKSYVDNAIANVQTIKGVNGKTGENISLSASDIKDSEGNAVDSVLTRKADKSYVNDEITKIPPATLNSLTDVVVLNANEGDVLSLNEGKWVPKKLDGASTGTSSFITPEVGDLIELSNTTPPKNPADITMVNSTKTSLKIKWGAGSFDTIKYKLYVDGVHHSTYDYLNRATELTNLLPYTDYEIKITSVNESGVESTGKLVTFKTTGYKLVMNGFLGSYLKLPAMLYNKIIIECLIERPAGTIGHLYDGRTEMVQSFVELLATSDSFGFYFNQRFVNGQEVNASKSIWIEDKVRTTLELVKSTGVPVLAVSKIFARFDDRNQLKGELYRIRCYNGVQLIADYNFGKGVYTDQTENGNELMHTAGEFI